MSPSGRLLAHLARDFEAMVQPRRLQSPHRRDERARFWFHGTVDHLPGRARGARLRRIIARRGGDPLADRRRERAIPDQKPADAADCSDAGEFSPAGETTSSVRQLTSLKGRRSAGWPGRWQR